MPMASKRFGTSAKVLAAISLVLACAARFAVGIQWQGRSIYFVLTDRFSKPGDDSVPCEGRDWCGGTILGIVDRLDYIQGMGFDAIWITPPVRQVPWKDQ